jgi:hypothetical protein
VNAISLTDLGQLGITGGIRVAAEGDLNGAGGDERGAAKLAVSHPRELAEGGRGADPRLQSPNRRRT